MSTKSWMSWESAHIGLKLRTSSWYDRTIVFGSERVSIDCRNINTKVITLSNHNNRKQRVEPIKLTIACNSQSTEKSRVRGATGFVIASHWLKNWARFLRQSLTVAIAWSLISTVIWELLNHKWKAICRGSTVFFPEWFISQAKPEKATSLPGETI